LWANSPLADPDVDGVVVDECSMLDERIVTDLLSFGKKLLALGDPAQLPPVRGSSFFGDREPDALLTEVHRHALESGILRLATFVRQGGDVASFESTPDCQIVRSVDLDHEEWRRAMVGASQIICGRNATRRRICASVRQALGKTSPFPEIGDRLVCLRNDRDIGVFNGSQWIVREIDEMCADTRTATLGLTSEDDETQQIVAPIWLHRFVGDELPEGWDRMDRLDFDYGYALTVHKSQGSQWDNVVLIDESESFPSPWRHVYTGATRSIEQLRIIL
jgi:exodeoxyribonuclease-5